MSIGHSPIRMIEGPKSHKNLVSRALSRFEEVVCGSLMSWGLFDGEKLAAMMVAETKKLSSCNPEVCLILSLCTTI